MTAADKLRELLATRPAEPSADELQRWWRSTGLLLPQLFLDVEGMDSDLVAERAALRREQDACARLRVELDRERTQRRTNADGFESALAQEQHEKSILEQVERDLRAELEMLRTAAPVGLARTDELFQEGSWRSCTGCHELDEGHPTGPYSAVFRCNLGSGCRECGGLGATWEPGHPKSWLDCEECRSLSKSGAEPPRCAEFLAMEDARATQVLVDTLLPPLAAAAGVVAVGVAPRFVALSTSSCVPGAFVAGFDTKMGAEVAAATLNGKPEERHGLLWTSALQVGKPWVVLDQGEAVRG